MKVVTYGRKKFYNIDTWRFEIQLNHHNHESGQKLESDVYGDDRRKAKVADVVVDVGAGVRRNVDDVTAEWSENDGAKVSDETLDPIVATHFLES